MESLMRRRGRRGLLGLSGGSVDSEAESLVEEALRSESVLRGEDNDGLGYGIQDSKVTELLDEDKRRFEEMFEAVNASEIIREASSRLQGGNGGDCSDVEESDAVDDGDEVPLQGPREDEQFCELSPRRPRATAAEERRRLSEEFEAEMSSAEESGVFYAPDRAPPLFDFLTIMTAFLVAVFAAYYSINM